MRNIYAILSAFKGVTGKKAIGFSRLFLSFPKKRIVFGNPRRNNVSDFFPSVIFQIFHSKNTQRMQPFNNSKNSNEFSFAFSDSSTRLNAAYAANFSNQNDTTNHANFHSMANAKFSTMKNFLATLIALLVTTFSFQQATAQLSGTKSIPGDYATISAAVTDLNTQGVGSGGVTFNVAAGYTQTLTGKIVITATGTAEIGRAHV